MAEPAAARVPIRELPPEVWKLILSNLDEPSLMTCRLVNKCLRNLATEVLSESVSFWTTTFEDSVGRRRATHFSTLDEVERFLSEMKEFPNPFPNGTLIFTPDDRNLSYEQREDFEAKFRKLLETFGDSIFSLVYGVRILTCRHLPDVLNLKNLKHLVIQSFDWKFCHFVGIDSPENLQKKLLPEKLTELIIHGKNGTVPISYLFRGIQSIPKSLSALAISNNSTFPLIDLRNVLCQLPNLKKLKVCYPTADLLRQFQQFQPNCVASLKEVSFDLNLLISLAEQVLNLIETFALVDFHAESLELLNLNVGFLRFAVEATGLNTSVKYRNVKTLVLRFMDILAWPPVIRELMEKLVNLHEFKLLLPDPPRFGFTPRRQYEIGMSCWNYLPASVRVITVPNYGWKIRRGETLQFNDDGEQIE